jgi:hypothetical protein
MMFAVVAGVTRSGPRRLGAAVVDELLDEVGELTASSPLGQGPRDSEGNKVA